MEANSIVDFFNSVNNNKLLILFASGGIIFTLFSNAKAILSSIANGILSVISFSLHSIVTAEYDIPPLIYKLNKVLAKSTVIWERNNEIQPSTSEYSENRMTKSTYGRSIRILLGKLVIVDRTYSMQSTKLSVSVSIRVFFARKQKFIDRIIKEIEQTSVRDNDDDITINMGKGITIEKPKRSIDTIYSNDNISERIKRDIGNFLKSKDIYMSNSSPWKYVSLLSGKPGCGKTSVVHAIASEFDMDVMFVSMVDQDFYDIARILTDSYGDNRKKLIVIEDIDAINSNMTDKRTSDGIHDANDIVKTAMGSEARESGMSLSSLLNLLDGIITPMGTVIFLTTNHPERLDDALIRDGRVDSHYEFTYLNGNAANNMINDHLGFKIENINDSISPSSLQRSILKVKTGVLGKDEFVKKFSVV